MVFEWTPPQCLAGQTPPPTTPQKTKQKQKKHNTHAYTHKKTLLWHYSRIAAHSQKAVQDTEALQEEIAVRDAKLLQQRQQVTRMEMELAQFNHDKDRSQTKLSSMGEESQVETVPPGPCRPVACCT